MATRTCPACNAELPDRERVLSYCPTCGAELASVRPPDLDAEALPSEVVDPLAGWDAVAVEDPAGDLPDVVVLVGATSLGALLGSALGGSGRRGRGGLVGGLVGLGAAAALRRPWELAPPDDAWARTHQR